MGTDLLAEVVLGVVILMTGQQMFFNFSFVTGLLSTVRLNFFLPFIYGHVRLFVFDFLLLVCRVEAHVSFQMHCRGFAFDVIDECYWQFFFLGHWPQIVEPVHMGDVAFESREWGHRTVRFCNPGGVLKRVRSNLVNSYRARPASFGVTKTGS